MFKTASINSDFRSTSSYNEQKLNNLEISQLPLLVNGLDLHESLQDQKNSN